MQSKILADLDARVNIAAAASAAAAGDSEEDDDEIRARVRGKDGVERTVEAEMILPEDDGPIVSSRTKRKKKKRNLGRK